MNAPSPDLASRFVDVERLPWEKTAYPGIEQKTLLVDMDPQGHCGVGLAVPEEQIERTILDCLIEESDGKVSKLNEIVWQIASDFDLAPSNIKLSAFEQLFAGRQGREDRLTKAIALAGQNYEWCIVDCPPPLHRVSWPGPPKTVSTPPPAAATSGPGPPVMKSSPPPPLP
jgi:hypothetical protein